MHRPQKAIIPTAKVTRQCLFPEVTYHDGIQTNGPYASLLNQPVWRRGELMSLTTNGKEALGNRLLCALPSDAYERLRPHLEPITFSLGEVVYESGAQMRYVYFPTTSHISLLYTMVDGSTAEMGLVGKEGVVGIAL